MTEVGSNTNPGTLGGGGYNPLAFIIHAILSGVRTVTLVQVLSCTNSGGLSAVGRVVVQPLVFQVSGNGTYVPHGEIHDVPYFRVQGGTDAVILDPKKGDIGIALFCFSDIASVKADPQAAVAAGGAAPGSFGMFDWADGLYIGGVLNGVPAQYIRFFSGGIEIVSPTKITLRAPTVEVDASTLFSVAAGAIDAEATGDAKLAGATAELQATATVTITGAAIDLAGPVTQSGGGVAMFSGTIETITGNVIAQGISLATHGHNPGTLEIAPNPVTGLAGTPT